jgi:Tfp pilus assembly protein PilF
MCGCPKKVLKFISLWGFVLCLSGSWSGAGCSKNTRERGSAEEELLRTIDVDLTHLDARFYLSMLYADRGDIQKACNQLREILKIDPTYENAGRLLEKIEKE